MNKRKTPLRKRSGRKLDPTINNDLPMMLWLATDGEVQIQKDLGAFHISERDCWLPVLVTKRRTETRETLEELMQIRETLCGISPQHADAWYYHPNIDQFDPEVQENPLSKTSQAGLRLAKFNVEARRELFKLRAVESVKREKPEDRKERWQVEELLRKVFEGYRANAQSVGDQKSVDAIANDLAKLTDAVMLEETKAGG